MADDVFTTPLLFAPPPLLVKSLFRSVALVSLSGKLGEPERETEREREGEDRKKSSRRGGEIGGNPVNRERWTGMKRRDVTWRGRELTSN